MRVKIKGFANLEDTKKYFNNKDIDSKHIRNTHWFYTLPMAIGTHLGDFSDEHSDLYVDAIIYGLEHGINFIDTAVNYRAMRSERDIGKVLKYLISEKKTIKREEIVISTKGGQIYGDYHLGVKPIDYLEKILIPNGILERKDVNIVDNHRHTLVPSFYKTAIGLSKENLGIETIDIHYIHNPEISMYVLGSELFYKQLEKLIGFYEEQVELGNIRFYGMATWDAFISDPGSRWYISLEKVMDIVKGVVGEKHHFKFIQLPYNKFNNLANIKTNQSLKGRYCTPIQVANELGLTVTISSPLNQSEGLSKGALSHGELLKYVINTEGVYATMVGTKTREHLKENMRGVITES
jgi:aryl-alcohol dehydrogenase-like predicted oxidoreductase